MWDQTGLGAELMGQSKKGGGRGHLALTDLFSSPLGKQSQTDWLLVGPYHALGGGGGG